jgi:hypothetical protein
LTTFTSEDRKNAVEKILPAVEVVDSAQLVREAPYHPGYEDAVVDPEYGRPLSQVLRDSMRASGKRFWAGDNISEFIESDRERQQLIMKPHKHLKKY